MDAYLIWLLIGLGLVIVELLTGTFYLLMLGVAAFGGAAVAFLGMDFGAQIVVTAIVAAAGCYGAHLYHAKNAKQQMKPVDAGQPANFESWLDEAAGLARVQYRGASWDALIESGSGALARGALLYVVATEGSRLRVSRQPPP